MLSAKPSIYSILPKCPCSLLDCFRHSPVTYNFDLAFDQTNAKVQVISGRKGCGAATRNLCAQKCGYSYYHTGSTSCLHRVVVLRMSTLSFYLINLLFSFFPLCGAWNSLEFLWYLRRCIETPSANMQRCWHLKHIMCYRSFSVWCVYYHCVFFVTSWYFPLLLPALCALLCREIHWTEGSDHRPLLTWDKMRFFFQPSWTFDSDSDREKWKGTFSLYMPFIPFSWATSRSTN